MYYCPGPYAAMRIEAYLSQLEKWHKAPPTGGRPCRYTKSINQRETPMNTFALTDNIINTIIARYNDLSNGRGDAYITDAAHWLYNDDTYTDVDTFIDDVVSFVVAND